MEIDAHSTFILHTEEVTYHQVDRGHPHSTLVAVLEWLEEMAVQNTCAHEAVGERHICAA